MTTRERFLRTMHPSPDTPPDRLPLVEWAPYWNVTVDRWQGEGLQAIGKDAAQLRREFGLDRWLQHWVSPRGPEAPEPEHFGGALIADERAYSEADYLHPYPAIDPEQFDGWRSEHDSGDAVVWMSVEGFFWFPRSMFGIEEHLYAFYDQPELLHRMNGELLEFNLRAVDEFCRSVTTPDFATVAEDMSYNHGPMLSGELFDEFLAPYYRELTGAMHERGILVIVDSDGDVTELVPWLEAVGVDGILPLERASHVDAAKLRSAHPELTMLGAYDKRVMQHGEQAMRAEFERLLPVMEQGRFVPSVDHQTPPDVSLANYRRYIELLTEYAQRAVGPRWGQG